MKSLLEFINPIYEKHKFHIKHVLSDPDYLENNLTFAEVQKCGKKLIEFYYDNKEKCKDYNIKKVALLGSSTQTLLSNYLVLEGLYRGFIVNSYVESMEQFRQAILDQSSNLYKFNPDIIFWHIELESFLAPRELCSGEWDCNKVIHEIDTLINFAKKIGIVYITDVHVKSLFPYFENLSNSEKKIKSFNEMLLKKYEDDRRVYICRFNDLCSYIGHMNVTDNKLFDIGKIYYSHKFSLHLSKKILAFLEGATSPRIKCIIVDLDNTLWGGIISEDGINGIQIGDEYPGNYYNIFQSQLLALKQQGLILAINSKNDNYVIDMLDRHKNMVLCSKDFQAIRTNWKNKYDNILSIASELNIGLSSIMFIDDSDIECEMVKKILPEVKVLRVPKKIEELPSVLINQYDINSIKLTEEDYLRNTYYLDEKKRVELKGVSENLEKFLVDLGTKVYIKSVDQNEYQRVYQLIQKTNQFNLTSIRYSNNDLNQLSTRDDYLIFTLYVSDNYGDLGLVGVMIIKKFSIDKWIIESFMMSCRVLGREIEKAFIKYIMNFAQSRGVKELIGLYISTNRNEKYKDFYKNMGFFYDEESSKKEHRYIYTLRNENIDYPIHIQVTYSRNKVV